MENKENLSPEIEKLKQQIEQKKALLKKKIAQQTEKQKKQNRARDTRRKILAGAVVLQRAQKDSEFAARLFQIIGEDLTEDRNRILFPEIAQK
jgi:septal ring factor EnvC (AmiA/AmiB activator)